MQAQLKRDTTRRTITLDVLNFPDIDVTTYHRTPRIFRPDTVTIVMVDGQVDGVTVGGGLVLKSGGTSDSVRESQRWYGSEFARRPETVPGWLMTLVQEAPQGVTLWRTGADAGEVQAL